MGDRTILVTGATGFCGHHLVGRLIADGHRVRALVRSTEHGQWLRDRLADGAGRFEWIVGDVLDVDSLRTAMAGVDTVAHLVGIIRERGRATFEAIHVAGTQHLLEAALAAGVQKFYYQSALGASLEGTTRYLVTKARAEELVRESGIPHVIFRPSIVVGAGGEFVASMVDLLRKAPVIPIFGDGEYTLQPIWVDDLNACIAQALARDDIRDLTMCLAGPEPLSFNKMVMIMGEVLGVRKLMIHIPALLVRSVVQPLLTMAETATELLPVTSDQLVMLAEGDTCDTTEMRNRFGIAGLHFKEAFERSVGQPVAAQPA